MEAKHDAIPVSAAPLLCEARTEASIDHPTTPLERLHQTAPTEIDRHVKLDGRCVICAAPFPCDRAVLILALDLF